MRTPEEVAADAVPFPAELIKKVPPRGEAYVSWTHYTQRLLKVHGAHQYHVTSVTYGDGNWCVAVQVEIHNGESYGGVGFDKDATHAESQAYKRACAHAGIGLHLYGEYWLDQDSSEPADTKQDTTQPEPPDPGRQRKSAKDYENAAKADVLLLLDGDKAEAAQLWPLLLEQAGVEKVTTKKGMEAVIRAANDSVAG